jgi:hypothetical protein
MQEILKIYSKYLHKSGSAAKDSSSFYNYFVVPFSAGLAGFATFLFLIIFLESAAYIMGITETWNVGINTVLIAAIGFILQFVYQLVKTVKGMEERT